MEAGLIGSDNLILTLLWSEYFIDVQGFEAEEAVMYQEYLSATILKNNGILSIVNQKIHICVDTF